MKKIKKFIDLIKDFERISFWRNSNWKKNYKVINILPVIAFEWDTQGHPIARNGEIIFEGYREFTIFFEWLWFAGGVVFEFKWTVRNPKDFEPIPPTESELKEIDDLLQKVIKP